MNLNNSRKGTVIQVADRTSRIVIVIPTLNEAQGIRKVIAGVKDAMDSFNYQVLVVDGHSVDGTDKIAKNMGAVLIYQQGKGYGDALRTGFYFAKKRLNAKVIVMMDADATYPPRHIPEMVIPILKDQSDFVVGNRFAKMQKGAMPVVNRFGNRFLSLLAKFALGLNVYDTQCGMRAFKSRLLDDMQLVAVGMPLAMEMLAEALSAGARMHEVPISYKARVGETKLHPLRDGSRIIGITLRLMFDIKPLLFFGNLGIVIGMLGLLLHYLLLPVDLAHVVFPLIFVIGALMLFGLGSTLYVFRKLRKHK